MALYNTPDYNARQRNGAPPWSPPPLQIPNFGEGPVGDIDVGGVRTSQKQLLDEYLRSLNDGAFAQQRLAESQRVAAEQERTRLVKDATVRSEQIRTNLLQRNFNNSMRQAELRATGIRNAILMKPEAIEARSRLSPVKTFKDAAGKRTQMPENLYTARNIKFAREYAESTGGPDAWEKLPAEEKRQKVQEFTKRLISGNDQLNQQYIPYVELPSSTNLQDEENPYTGGALPNTYGEFTSDTYTLQNRYLPITVAGRSIAGLPIGLQNILEQVYGGTFGVGSTPAQSKLILSGKPALMLKSAEAQQAVNESAGRLADIAILGQQLINQGIDPSVVQDYGFMNLWTEALAEITASKLSGQLAAGWGRQAEINKAVGNVPKSDNKNTGILGWIRGLAGDRNSTQNVAAGQLVINGTRLATAISAPGEYINTAYQAANFALNGEAKNWLDGARVAAAAIAGRGWGGDDVMNFIGGDKVGPDGTSAAKLIAAVDTDEERQMLGLKSWGENLSFLITSVPGWFTGENTGRYDVTIDNTPWIGILGGPVGLAATLGINALHDSGALKDAPGFGGLTQASIDKIATTNVSGFFDAGWRVISDPFTYTPFVANSLGAKLSVTGAKIAIRQGAAAEARTATRILLGDVVKQSASQNFVDDLFVKGAQAKAYLRPSSVLSEAQIAQFATTGRAVVIKSTAAKSWFQQAEDVISRFGTDIKQLSKSLKNVDSSVLQEIAVAAAKGGTEAAMAVLRESVLVGRTNITITLRRQVASTISSYMQSPGQGLGDEVVSGLAGGRSVPILLGRSSIKPAAGNVSRKLEGWANRIGKYGQILGDNPQTRIASVVYRLSSNEKSLVQDNVKQVNQLILDAGMTLGPEDYVARLTRLAQIGLDTEVMPGLDKVAYIVAAQSAEGADAAAIGEMISHLEVIVELTINGTTKDSGLLGRELMSRLAGVKGPDDQFLEAIRRVKLIGEEEIPRLKQLEEWIYIDETSLGIVKMPHTPKKVFTQAVKELVDETNRLIRMKGVVEEFSESMYMLREKAVNRLANALRVVKDWEIHRAKHIRDWSNADSALKRELDDGLATIKTERDALLARREYIASRETQMQAMSKSDSWIQNKNGTWSSRQTVADQTKDWIDRSKREVNDSLRANSAARRELTTRIRADRKELRNNLDAVLDNPDIVRWNQEAARELQIARSEMKSLSYKNIKTISGMGEANVRRSIQDLTDPLERYAAIKGINAIDISDPYIRGVVLSRQKIAMNGIFTEVNASSVDPAWMDAVTAQVTQMEGGEKLVGRQFNVAPVAGEVELVGAALNTANENLGLLGRRAINARMQKLPAMLREYFDRRITERIQEGVFDITDIAREVERFASNPRAAEAVALEMMKESNLFKWVQENAFLPTRKFGAVATAKEKVGKLGLSFIESVAPKTVRFASHENAAIALMNRLEEVDRIAMDYQFDAVTRAELRTLALQARSVDDIYPIITEMQQVWAAHMNIPYKILRDRQNQIWKETNIGFMVDEDGVLLPALTTLSQRTNEVLVMSADDARAIARRYQAELTEKIAIEDGVVWTGRGTQFANAQRLRMTDIAQGTIGKVAKKTHTWWKRAVVTGAPTMFIGASAGFYYGDPSTSNDDGFGFSDHKLSSALLGAMLGSIGGIRYIGRVAGIEERGIRYSLARGWSPKEWIPGMSKLRDLGIELPMRHADQLVSSTSHPMSHISYNKLLAVTDGQWVALKTTDKYFDDAWLRIINRQINPASPGSEGGNILDRIILENFDSTDANWRELAKEFLDSPAGAQEKRRLLNGLNAPKNIDEVLDGYELFVSRYLPTEDIRRIRLHADENGVTIQMVKEWRKSGVAPSWVHAERTWVLPKMGDIVESYKTVYGRLIMEAPTTKLNRVPMAKSIYADEYKELRRLGVAPEIARNIAEERAVRLTNKVMFQLSDESRFAAKADFVFPFQQPREELLRVYTSLVLDNQARTLRFTNLGAIAFNNGVEGGVFYEDAMGEYRMRIPGSTWLSRVFGAPDSTSFDFKVRDLFFLLQGNAFAAASSSPDFTLDKPINVLLGTLPSPGGPFWSTAVSQIAQFYPDFFKDLQDNNPWVYNRMFPYGIQGTILRPEATRLWEAFSMSTPPWEFADQVNQQNSLNDIQIKVVQEMMYENRDNPNYIDYLDSEEGMREIREKTSGVLLGWVTAGSLTPAPTRPIMGGQKEFESIKNTLIEQYGETNWYSKLYELRPDIASIYFQRKTEANDEGSFDRWLQSASGDMNLRSFKFTKVLGINDYLDEIKAGQVKTKMMNEINAAYNQPTFGYKDKYATIREIEARYSSQIKEYKIDPRNEYLARKELAKIVATSNESNYNENINAWRKQFDVSAKDYKDWLAKSAFFRLDPYKETRTIDEILYGEPGIQAAINKGPQHELIAVSKLAAAEQVKYWQNKLSQISYYDMSPEDIAFLESTGREGAVTARKYENIQAALSQDATYRAMIAKVYAANPQLNYASSFKVDSATRAAQKALLEGNGQYLDMLNGKIALTSEARNNAYKNKDWTTYNSLKQQIASLYDQRKIILEDLYDKYPDMIQLQEDAKGIVYLQNNPNSPNAKFAEEQLRARYAELGIPMLIFGREEQNYLDSPPAIRAAMKDELIVRLNVDAGDYVINGVDQKMYWERLTPFQRQILENSPLPDSLIEKWKGTTPSSGGFGGNSLGGATGMAAAALSYAKAMMAAYSKRPKGAKAPAAYDEYRRIPASNGVAKQAFLRANPEVADWIRLGPLANMSDLDRLQVINIMVTYGNWEGEPMDVQEVTNLAWAREQLKVWSRRTGDKPATYDIWLNMPSGAEKAEYIRQHPEVQEWIKAGPMSNMPDTYKEVVRDIMTKYGEWTASTDPLGETISAFYSTPASGRQEFLDKHPELREYWRAIRTPEEQQMADLTERYFSIPDATARKMFISAHPELQQHFVDSRNNRYQKFLEKVAFYMGSNPSVFEEYLNVQTKVLGELIGRFGTPSLVRERIAAPVGGSSGQGTSGRVRQVSGRR